MARSRVPYLSTVAFVFAGTLLGIVAWLCFRESQKTREADARVVRTLIVRANITTLLQLLDEAETGQRGFVITGNPSYLAAYQNALRLLPGQMADLRTRTRDDAVQQADLAQLNQLIAQKTSEMGEVIRARETQGFDAASRMVSNNSGKKIMDRIRDLMASMRAEEVQVYNQRQEVSARDSRASTVYSLVGLLLAVLIVLGSGLLLARQYRRLERTEEELQQSERRFRLLVEGVQDYAIFALDAAGRVASWNAGAERIHGYGPAEIIGQHFSCFYAQPDVEGGKAERAMQVAASQGRFQDEGWRVRKGGSQFWASVVMTAVSDQHGRLIGYSKITRDLTARKHAEEALRESERSLRQLSTQLLRIQDEERRRFARDLHDSAGQCLAMLKMRLDLLESGAELDDSVRQKLTECIGLASETIKEVRATCYELYPPMLEEAGLRSAIPWFLDGFMQRSGVTTRFEIPDQFERPPRDVEVAIFRVLQESLTNVRRHSGSAAAHVRVEVQDGMVRLVVADEGKGIPRELLDAFNQGALGKLGIGLRGMKERIRQLGGDLEVSSNGHGTIVTATVPVQKAS